MNRTSWTYSQRTIALEWLLLPLIMLLSVT